MHIGLVGVGRLGAFHAATLKGLDRVEQGVVSDADPARARAVAKDLEQDIILAGPPQAVHHAPIADVRASIEHLSAIAGALS